MHDRSISNLEALAAKERLETVCLLGLTEHPRSYRTLPSLPAPRLSGTGPRALYILAYLYTYFYLFSTLSL
jgi:hypothetical protein